MDNYIPYVTNTHITDFTREELFEIDLTLELEYLGGHVSLDTDNISALAKGNSAPKLSRFTLHTNIVGPVMDKENTTYINPPTRTYQTKNGGKVSKRVEERLIELYEQTRFDLFMAKAEKMTSLLGTTLFKPIFDEDDKTMSFVEMYPSNQSLKLISSPKIPGKIDVITYTYKINKIEYTVVTDRDKTVVTWTDENNVERTDLDEHGFGILPFAILKFKLDNARPYGPPDFELYSLCKHRSLVLANTMARMHLSDLEKLMVMGVTKEEALAGITAQMIVLPSKANAEGDVVNPTAQFISPDGQDALNLLEAYFKLYHHIMDNRGHVQKIFSRGADVPSAESIRLGSIDLSNKQQEKKKFLTRYEQDVFIRLIKENNRYKGNVQIPEDTQIMINFKPEPYAFSTAADEVTYFMSAIWSNVETKVSWIKNRNPELTDDEAAQLWEDNKKFNDENKDITNDPVPEGVPERVPENDEQDIN